MKEHSRNFNPLFGETKIPHMLRKIYGTRSSDYSIKVKEPKL